MYRALKKKVAMNSNEILDQLTLMFPDAQCELNHQTPFQLLIAVILSAQTSDVSVNKVTPALFEKYGDPERLANAELSDIESLIHSIGLYRNKAKHIKACARQIHEQFRDEVPATMKQLLTLDGVGRKTANVVLSVAYDVPSVPVDTHVERISKRLGFAKQADSVEVVEQKLKRKIKQERWNRAHHLFIFFGRYHCTARSPQCEHCPFIGICKKDF